MTPRAIHIKTHVKGRLTTPALLGLAALLIAPGLAIHRLAPPLDLRWIGGWLFCISVITYALYSSDKKKAQAQQWRTPESTLHFVELIGGWPAAFLAQKKLRHKISKTSFQLNFWIIVAAYQYAACDFLSGWAMSRDALDFIFEHIG